MKIHSVAWTTYRIPFAHEFTTSRGSDSFREGLLLRLSTDDGLVGLGEGSPLPPFGGGTLIQTSAAISRLAPRLLGLEPVAAVSLAEDLFERREIPTAAACAVDIASSDLLAQGEDVPLAAVFCGVVEDEVPANATIGLSDDAAAAMAARDAVQAGFTCIKLKVGLGASESDEVERVAAVRQAIGPDPALRLDANGAWDVEDAIAIIRAVEPFGIQLVEQPVPADDIPGLLRVRTAVSTPIAADESAHGLQQARRIIQAEAADFLIVKVMAAGGLHPANRMTELAYAAGFKAIVTTTIDSGVGVAAALHLAATLPAPAPACGLATGPLLAADLLTEPLAVDRGLMRLPPGPGIGVRLDERQLALYANPWREVSG